MTPRFAAPRDYARFAELFRILDPHGPLPDRARWEGDFLGRTLVVDGEVEVGAYVYFDAFHDAAYISQLVVDPSVRRTGVGRGLMTALGDHLLGQGIRAWALNVEHRNVAAVRLYESLGMVRAGASVSLRFPWSLVDRLPAGPLNVVGREVEAAEDASLEALFQLSRGRLDVGRKKVGRHVVAIFEAGAPAGLAVFAPALPGTFPFRLIRRELVTSLLAALRRVADPGRDFTLVAVDDDPILVRLLVDHGAEIYMTAVRYSGQLDPRHP